MGLFYINIFVKTVSTAPSANDSMILFVVIFTIRSTMQESLICIVSFILWCCNSHSLVPQPTWVSFFESRTIWTGTWRQKTGTALSSVFLSRFWVSKWHPKILQWHPKFWKPRHGFALYWSKTIWGKHVFLHVAIATDGWADTFFWLRSWKRKF